MVGSRKNRRHSSNRRHGIRLATAVARPSASTARAVSPPPGRSTSSSTTRLWLDRPKPCGGRCRRKHRAQPLVVSNLLRKRLQLTRVDCAPMAVQPVSACGDPFGLGHLIHPASLPKSCMCIQYPFLSASPREGPGRAPLCVGAAAARDDLGSPTWTEQRQRQVEHREDRSLGSIWELRMPGLASLGRPCPTAVQRRRSSHRRDRANIALSGMTPPHHEPCARLGRNAATSRSRACLPATPRSAISTPSSMLFSLYTYTCVSRREAAAPSQRHADAAGPGRSDAAARAGARRPI
jgi:hypothetical protein